MPVALWRRVIAEAVGTFVLVTAGCGAIVVNQQSGALGHVGVALSFGLVIIVMVAALGHVSGAHFNPAVTVAFATARLFVITAVATDTRAVGQLAAIAIGATVALDALWGGPVTGASMNPARSLGPALVGGQWRDHWVYWLGPIAGALLGSALYALLRGHPKREV